MNAVSSIQSPSESIPFAPDIAQSLLALLEQARRVIPHDARSAETYIARATSLLGAGDQPPQLHIGGLTPWQLKLVSGHIATNLDRSLPIAELARVARLSVSHFSRAFRASLGMSPHAFVMHARIDEARTMMLRTHQPLCEIALACGLADQAHLSRLFRRIQGVSPAAWRRLHQAGPARER